MGIVLHARDESLDRDVAIKVLPDSMAFDAKRMSRFQREGKLLASLNHPNIAAIYEVDQDESRQYVVLEYVPGDTLDTLIRRGPVPWMKMLPIAIQISDAIEYAHEQGVIHRDLKPQNIKFDAKGNAKVLDFGLAKAIGEEEISDTNEGEKPSPTQQTVVIPSGTSHDFSSTKAGVMMGTIGYLSPEQACGHDVDKQTDVFSFGCILFEMLTGNAPFASNSAVDAIGRTLHKDPEWDQLPTTVPQKLKSLIRRCLSKEKKDRLRDIGDAKLELLELQNQPHDEGTESASSSGSSVILAVALFATLAAFILAGLYFVDGSGQTGMATDEPGPPLNRAVVVPDELKIDAFSSSADDEMLRMVCYREVNLDRKGGPPKLDWRLYVRGSDSSELREIYNFTGFTGFTFSPNGRAFVLNKEGRIYRGNIDSTADPVELARIPDSRNASGGFSLFPGKRGIVWFDDETIIIEAFDEQDQNQLVVLDARTGDIKKTVPIKLASKALRFDGLIGKFDDDHVLMYVSLYNDEGFSINIATVSLTTGELKVLIERAGFAQAIDDHIFFSRGDTIYMADYDPESHKLLDAGHPVMEGLHSTYGTHGSFNITNNGTLVHKPGGMKGSKRRLLINTIEGEEPSGLPHAPFDNAISVSGDGSRICTTLLREDGMWEVWGGTFDPPRLRKILARTDADYCFPMLSYDGTTVICARVETTDAGVEFTYMIGSTDGSRPNRPLMKFKLADDIHMRCFNMDNTRILADRLVPGQTDGLRELVEFDAETGEMTPFLSHPGGATEALWSPDGSLVLFKTMQTGVPELYVHDPRNGETIRVSDIPVGTCRWIEHPDETYSVIYWDPDWNVWESTINFDEDGELLIGQPRTHPLVVSKTALFATMDNRGKAYVIQAGIDDAPPNHLVTIENWLPHVLKEDR